MRSCMQSSQQAISKWHSLLLFRIRTSTVLYKEEYLAVRSRGRNDTVFCKAREDGVSLTRAADVAGGSAVHAGDTTAKTAGASALGCRSAGLHFRIFVKMFSSAELSSFSKCVLGLSSRGWARWRRACVLLSGTWAMLVGGSETGRTGHSEGGTWLGPRNQISGKAFWGRRCHPLSPQSHSGPLLLIQVFPGTGYIVIWFSG